MLPDEREENYSIIEEAAAICGVSKREKMTSEVGSNDVTHRDVTVALLAELQDEQDKEMADSISKIPQMVGE